jgi:hypothetical protein
MSKTVTFLADVYPYCLGDVVVLNDDELKQVDKIAKARKQQVYQVGPQAQVDSSAEADRQAAELKVKADAAEAKAQAKLAAEEAKKADAAAHNSASGKTVSGTSAGTKVKTAAS